MNELVRQAEAGWEKLKSLALDSVTSPHSRDGDFGNSTYCSKRLWCEFASVRDSMGLAL